MQKTFTFSKHIFWVSNVKCNSRERKKSNETFYLFCFSTLSHFWEGVQFSNCNQRSFKTQTKAAFEPDTKLRQIISLNFQKKKKFLLCFEFGFYKKIECFFFLLFLWEKNKRKSLPSDYFCTNVLSITGKSNIFFIVFFMALKLRQ